MSGLWKIRGRSICFVMVVMTKSLRRTGLHQKEAFYHRLVPSSPCIIAIPQPSPRLVVKPASRIGNKSLDSGAPSESI